MASSPCIPSLYQGQATTGWKDTGAKGAGEEEEKGGEGGACPDLEADDDAELLDVSTDFSSSS